MDNNTSKIRATLILVFVFILGFSFKYYFDFKSLTKIFAQKNGDAKTRTTQTTSLLSGNIGSSQFTTISDVIHAQEEQKIIDTDIYVTPDQNPNFLPIRDWSVPSIEIEAKSAIVTNKDASRILYQKNIEEKLPIASLTKLMTAIIVFENSELTDVVKVSKSAVDQEGDAGKLIVDENIAIENLLRALLIESSNDAAYVLEEFMASKDRDLIGLMNIKSQTLGLKNTRFSSSSGLSDQDNYSTTQDYAKLAVYSLENKTIWDILKMPAAEIYSINYNDDMVAKKSSVRYLANSNQLLGRIAGLMGGKTGYTTEANGCLLTATRVDNEIIISIVLGSDDRFGETEKLINWVKSAYRFTN